MRSKKFFSLILSVILLLTALPFSISTFAATVDIPDDAIEYNGHYYKLYDENLTWTQARAFCEDIGGHLLTVSSESENSYIVSVLKSNATKNCYWIGTYYDVNVKKWKNVTGEDTVFFNWAENEPNSFETQQEYYVHLFGKRRTGGIGIKEVGQWNDSAEKGADYSGDFYSITNFGFICEWDSVYAEPFLEPESAAVFISFLSNNSNLTEAQITSDSRYQIMTKTYFGADKEEQAEALIDYAVTATCEMASKTVENDVFLHDLLKKYLERCLGGETGLTTEDINKLQAEASENINNLIYDIIYDLVSPTPDNEFEPADIYDTYSYLTSTADKAEAWAEIIIEAMEKSIPSVTEEKAGKYAYFNLYIKNRGNYATADDENFIMIMKHNEELVTESDCLSDYLNQLDWISDNDYFNDPFSVINDWAEYIYQLSCYYNSCKMETSENAFDIDSLVHSPDKCEVLTKPTWDTNGLIQKKCTICEKVISEAELILGDTNNSSFLDIGDLVDLRKNLLKIFEIEAWKICVFDVDGNGCVDIRDLVRLKKELC